MQNPKFKEIRINQILNKLVSVLCETPALILGINKIKGSISKNKHADFVVWDPESVINIDGQKISYAKPSMHTFYGKELYGLVKRTYLRGTCIYNSDQTQEINHKAMFISNQRCSEL